MCDINITMQRYLKRNLLEETLYSVKKCELCAHALPYQPRPIIQGSETSKILIVGQAPGIKAHESNTPWNDASGDRLRMWLGVARATFYDARHIAIVPMGFCYPGKGKSGDLPPRKECAPAWHSRILSQMPIAVTLLIGQYAQNYYLPDQLPLTERVKRWRDYLPGYFVLPHPSPRNNIWLKRHPWFEEETIPQMREEVASYLK